MTSDSIPVEPVPLHRRTLAEVLALPDADDVRCVPVVSPGEAAIELRRQLSWMAGRIEPCRIPGYGIGHWGDWRRGGVVVVREIDDLPVGGVVDGTLFVDPSHRGMGLGTEILIRAFEAGVKHPDQDERHALTDAGRATRIRAHATAVARAVRSGLPVDPGILDDYPELASGPPTLSSGW